MEDFSNFKNFSRFSGVNLMGIDYGKKITGVATFTPGRDPYPLPFTGIPYKNDDSLLKELLKIIEDEAIEMVIMGIPYRGDGTSSDMTNTVLTFSQNLKTACEAQGLKLHLQNEYLTSYEAKDRMKKMPRYNFQVKLNEIDAFAASIILEDFIKSDGAN